MSDQQKERTEQPDRVVVNVIAFVLEIIMTLLLVFLFDFTIRPTSDVLLK